MSATVTILSWGLLEYKDAYESAGQLEYMYDCIRWPLEWLLKCHTAPNELYIQVNWLTSQDLTINLSMVFELLRSCSSNNNVHS